MGKTTGGIAAVLVLLFVAVSVCNAAALTDKEKLGKNLFYDDRLSEPSGQACSDCHSPGAGFNGIGDATRPVYEGAVANVF